MIEHFYVRTVSDLTKKRCVQGIFRETNLISRNISLPTERKMLIMHTKSTRHGGNTQHRKTCYFFL